MIINNCFKIRGLILVATLITSLGFVNHAFALPDFVVPDITGPTTIIRESGGETTIPIEVVVGNQGTDPARLYGKNNIVYTYESGAAFMAPFKTPFETNSHFFRRKAWIDPGSRVTLNGTVKVPSPRLNEVISLSAIVDWCKSPSGTEHCRVRESNEKNNESQQISTEICTPGPFSNPVQVQGISDLGPLPTGMSVNWPRAPSIEGKPVRISNLSQFEHYFYNDDVDKSRTRFEFHTNINRPVPVNASDVEIVIMPGFKLRNIDLVGSVQRIKISGGGEVGQITARVGLITPVMTADDSGYITDVLIDHITLDNSDRSLCPGDDAATDECYGVMLQGVRRVAVVNSTINSLVYSIVAWKPLTSPSILPQNQDIITANNRLHSKNGRQATVRMHDSVRTVTVHNRLQNGADYSGDGVIMDVKHNYRVHGFPVDGFSDRGGARYAYAACNLFVNSGAMIGEGAGPVGDEPEDVRHYWFNSNQFHQSANSLYQMGFSETRTPYVHNAEIRGNRAYSAVSWHLAPPRCFYCPSGAPADWVIRDNVVEPHQMPPD